LITSSITIIILFSENRAMKHFYVFLVILAGLQPSILAAQNEYPNIDIDYTISYSSDEQGIDYEVFSYILENICGEDLLFYHFTIASDDLKYEIITPLPEDVLILESGSKASYLKVKIFTQGPSINWVCDYMRVTGEGEAPLRNRDYVFYDEYVVYDNDVTYSYFLKNISDNGIMFYDFTLLNENNDQYVYMDIPTSLVAARADQSFQIYEVSVNAEAQSPLINWNVEFIDDDDDSYYSFYQTEYDFCDGLIHILNEGKTEFNSIRGPIKNSSDGSLFSGQSHFCSAHITGFHSEILEYSLYIWSYTADIGYSGSFSDVQRRMELIQTQLSECIPTTMIETIVPKEDLYYCVKQIKYNGVFNGDSHTIGLTLEYNDVDDDLYKLKLDIDVP